MVGQTISHFNIPSKLRGKPTFICISMQILAMLVLVKMVITRKAVLLQS